MNMGIANPGIGAKLSPKRVKWQAGPDAMNPSSDKLPAQDITILLVEDDPPTLWRLQDALAKAGFDVAAAATLAEARRRSRGAFHRCY